MLANRMLEGAAGKADEVPFVFTVVTTAPSQTFTLPIYDGGSYGFNADWGDLSNSDITSFDDADRIHTYASAGTYEINITGNITGWRFNNVGDKLKIYEIKSWGILRLGTLTNNFFGCSNLTITATDAMTSTGGTSFSNCFRSCTSITSIPANLFDKNTAITTFDSCFYNCTGLTSIPANLFDKNTSVTAFSGCFRSCTSITSIPANLFDYNTLITTFAYCFNNCTGLTSIPANLFDYNTLITSFYACFQSCTSITSIPANLFDYNTLITLSHSCFYDCTSITALPDNLILYNVEIDNCGSMFKNCSGITAGDGTAFVDRAELHGITTHDNCFTGATNIPDYNLIPANWGGGGA